jgi:hypothetical protein
VTYHVPLTALLVLALAAPSPDQGPSPAVTEVSEPTDLMSALRASDVAEIYVLPRELDFVTAVRTLGCRYVVRRVSTAWTELESALNDAGIRIIPGRRSSDVRVGLVLGDRRGIIFEAYSPWPSAGAADVPGLSQRLTVDISPRFATVLESFALGHRGHAIPVVHPMVTCPPPARPGD